MLSEARAGRVARRVSPFLLAVVLLICRPALGEIVSESVAVCEKMVPSEGGMIISLVSAHWYFEKDDVNGWSGDGIWEDGLMGPQSVVICEGGVCTVSYYPGFEGHQFDANAQDPWSPFLEGGCDLPVPGPESGCAEEEISSSTTTKCGLTEEIGQFNCQGGLSQGSIYIGVGIDTCPDCGDDVCDPAKGEDCDACPEDCGYCCDAETISCGVGACYVEVPACIDGQPQDCMPGIPIEEICGDDIDNDCDGETDEDCNVSFCGDGACEPPDESCLTCTEDCGPCPPECGDGNCDAGLEDCLNCPEDCSSCCGDGDCNVDHEEDCQSCSADCGVCCGDGECLEDHGEECLTCPEDCGECEFCGDEQCTEGEDCSNCEVDCGLCCGDGECDPELAESCVFCPEDCGACCGDGECKATHGEDCSSCAEDCGACCGDAQCVAEHGEDCSTCAEDCGLCCGNGACEAAHGEDCAACVEDCGECCGNGACEAARGEDCWTCPDDCGSCCGDGACQGALGEDCVTCPADCGACPECGDGSCDAGLEDCLDCPEDCGACCGDADCVVDHGEDCFSCADDCGQCCGDGQCVAEHDEDCSTCAEDCGECCGDGQCQEQLEEDCNSCPDDCGECICTQPPSVWKTVSITMDIDEEQAIMGTGGSVKVGAHISSYGKADMNKQACIEGLAGGGEVGGCMSVAYQKTCALFTLDVGGQCEKAMVCEEPPAYACDESNYCCGGSIMGGGKFTKSFNPYKKFEVFKVQAKCQFEIGAGVGGSISGNATWGPACDCEKLSAFVTPRLRGEGFGGGMCGVKAFGKTLAGVGASAKACVNVGVSAGYGCDFILKPVGGVSFRINVDPIVIGWFKVKAMVKLWTAGSGCSGATDY